MQQEAKRATKVNITLGGLRQLRPEQIRQLYQAYIALVVDRASTVWHKRPTAGHGSTIYAQPHPLRVQNHSDLHTEVEAYVLLTHLRLRYCAQNTITRLHTLPRDHRIWTALSRVQTRRDNIRSVPTGRGLKDHESRSLDRLETIDPRLTTTIGDHYVIPPHTFHMFFYFF